MTRNIMPATTGGSMNGEISSDRSSPGIPPARNSSSASQVPPASCIASDARYSTRLTRSPFQNSGSASICR